MFGIVYIVGQQLIDPNAPVCRLTCLSRIVPAVHAEVANLRGPAMYVARTRHHRLGSGNRGRMLCQVVIDEPIDRMRATTTSGWQFGLPGLQWRLVSGCFEGKAIFPLGALIDPAIQQINFSFGETLAPRVACASQHQLTRRHGSSDCHRLCPLRSLVRSHYLPVNRRVY